MRRVTNQATVTMRHMMWVIAVLLVSVAACSSGDSGTAPTPTSTIPPISTSAVPDSCDRVTAVFPVAGLEDASPGDCGEWIDRSSGRAVLGSVGSASVWTRSTEHSTALIVGAVHTLGEGWFAPAGTAVEETVWDPAGQVGVLRLHLILPDGSGTDPLASPLFVLYNPAIAPERNGNRMQDVLPREDFYVGVTDSQRYDVSGPVPMPEPIVHGPVPLHDPSDATLTAPTLAEAEAGELVLLLGFPNETRELTAAVGRVMTDAEASAAVVGLAARGDAEGAIPYDSGVEMFIEGAALAGMSGGPVVDRQGRIVGVMVRASDEHNGAQYVRAVRLSYVTSQLDEAINALPSERRSAISGYLER